MINILLVEDEKEAQNSIIRLLATKGYRVIAVSTATEALTLLNKERFNLAIIDLILPDMHGHELCALLRRNQRLKELPIIISSGVADDSTQKISKDLGVNIFLNKPYLSEELISAIESCL